MKITKEYIAANADGSFIQCCETQTHTGTHVHVSSTNNIEEANTFPNPHFNSFGLRNHIAVHQWIPVQVRREVILLGYGVKHD